MKDVTEAGITLAVEATVEVAGKEVEAEPQTVTQGWHGESADREAVITDLGEDNVTIAGRAIPCRVERVEIAAPSGRTVTKTWYSERIAPHVLRREAVTYDAQTGQEISQTHVEVVALARPLRVLRRARQGAELLVVHKHPGGRTRTRVRSSLDVPGGVVEHESEEFDAAGQLTRRSKLELIDYSVK
ncbi:MAG: hypothetical protein HYX69_12870 [Planctomycetia bacterium]|nr:hypothetical protein [Planctomycetia bacterium]